MGVELSGEMEHLGQPILTILAQDAKKDRTYNNHLPQEERWWFALGTQNLLRCKSYVNK
jgi:hypothetical protein